MRVYVDSSALIKRAVAEAESDALEAALDQYVDVDAVLVSSSLAWVEVVRALRTLPTDGQHEITDTLEAALSGVAERSISSEVVSLARRIGPPALRSLDAIHLATAVLLDADVVLTYDQRLADACGHSGLTTTAPAADDEPPPS